MTGTDLSRRNFVVAGTTAMMALTGSVAAQDSNTPEFQAASVLVGPSDARPDPDDEFFSRKTTYGYLYRETDTGNVAHITQGDGAWTTLTGEPVTATYTGDGDSTGREIVIGFEPRWFEIHRDDSSNAEVYEGVGTSGDHAMRTVGGALTTDIDRSTSVYATANGVMVGDGDASHGNTSGADYVVVALP